MRLNPWYLLLAALVAGSAYLLSLVIEPYEEPVDAGWSQAALRNPYLAAEHYLDHLSIAAESSDRLDVLDELTLDTTLVIGNANHVLSEKRAAELIDWMHRGGQVIVAAQFYDYDQPDVLLQHFDITKHPADDGYFDADAAPEAELVDEENSEDERSLREALEEAGQQAREEYQRSRVREQGVKQKRDVAETIRRLEALAIADNLVPLSFDDMDYVLRMDFSGSGSLSHPAMYTSEEYTSEEYTGEEYLNEAYTGDEEEYGYQPLYWTGNDSAVGFMQVEVGAGLLTVMADLNIWTSSQLGLYDHAYLLELMTERSDKVVFLYGALVPTLFDRIWEHFYELMIVLMILSLAWIVYRANRFGPVAELGDLGRRSFKEHILAVASFLWRQDMGDKLMDAARNEVWDRLNKRYPAFERLEREQQLRKLAEVSQLPLGQARALMLGAAPSDEVQFFQSIKSLQKIRNIL